MARATKKKQVADRDEKKLYMKEIVIFPPRTWRFKQEDSVIRQLAIRIHELRFVYYFELINFVKAAGRGSNVWSDLRSKYNVFEFTEEM